jgi:hypothetical protein
VDFDDNKILSASDEEIQKKNTFRSFYKYMQVQFFGDSDFFFLSFTYVVPRGYQCVTLKKKLVERIVMKKLKF